MNSETALEAVVAGHICYDVIPAFRSTEPVSMQDVFVPGKLVNMGSVTMSTGGPVSNTGIALSILGIKTKLMGKIGNDFFGQGVLGLLAKRGADDGMIVVEGEDTSYTIVIAPPGCDRIFLHNPGANNTFVADDIDYDLVAQAKLFHLGYPPLMRKLFSDGGKELIDIFRRVKELGVTTSLDMSLPDPGSESGQVDWERLLRDLLPYVDLYLPSVEETMFMIQRDEYNRLHDTAVGHDMLQSLDMNVLPRLGQQLRAFGAKVVAIKCGVRGFYVTTADEDTLRAMGKARPSDITNWASRELLEESFHVKNVASATGSGDSSIAGFLAAFLRGKSIEETIRIACAVGGQNVQTFDALSGIHGWDETLAMINGWEKNRLEISEGSWTFDSARGLWIGNDATAVAAK